MKATLVFTLAITLLTGCATDPFAKYYQSYTNQMPVVLHRRLQPPSETPQVVTIPAGQYKDQERRMVENGLVVLGSASFWGFDPTQEQLIRQAKKVGADVAVWTSEYSHTEQGMRPLVSYQPGQTYTTTHSGSATANIYGPGGYAYGSGTYSGYSTTTTPDTMRTDYVPYQRRVYNHGASFWRRTKPPVFGAYVLPLPDDLRNKLQRNTGAYVNLVMNAGPAFRANIMRGDVIVEFADKPVSSPGEVIDLSQRMAGQEVNVKVLRGDQALNILVKLNPDL